MAAAFELTRPALAGKYRVTVYQQGFRLGGKGASGRGASDRIEEHGLHLWMGFYENAFRLMRECYAELDRDPRRCRIADWRDAFAPDHINGVADYSPSGAWLPWLAQLPPQPGLPGDPADRQRPWTVADYMSRAVALLRTLLETIQVRRDGAAAPAASTPYPTQPAAVIESIGRVLRIGQLATLEAASEALRLLELAMAAFPQYPENLVAGLHESISAAVRAQLDALVGGDDELRRLAEIAELTLATLRGVMRFRLMSDPRGFDAIDDYECRDWLRMNGASDRALNSGFIRALYDLGFSYEDGDTQRPSIAAGQAVRATLRSFFTYRGAFFWKMRSGMGDVVFAPFYEVLSRRGVRFEFFHRLTSLQLSPAVPNERAHVQALEFAVQAKLRGNEAHAHAEVPAEYRPLIDVRGLPCWPAEPDYRQLEDGERLCAEGRDFESHWDARAVEHKTLCVGSDFDVVVLAVGLGAVPYVCRELVERDPRWRAMVDHVKTVPTQAFQLWLNKDMAALGWPHGPINISGFIEPFDTWADMTHLVSEESHDEAVRAIAYFCSVLRAPSEEERARPDYPIEQQARVKAHAIEFLNRDIAHLWPRAVRDRRSFRWELLVGHDVGSGEARFDGQFWRANVNPSDHYVLSLPGSARHRISPLDHSYDNLTIAGDWTACGFNAGCVEAAVMSGRLAAHAISESPALDDIVGFDHP